MSMIKTAKLGVLGMAATVAATVAMTSYADDTLRLASGAKNSTNAESVQQTMQQTGPYSPQMLERVSTALKLDTTAKAKAADLFAQAREERGDVLKRLQDLRAPMLDLDASDADYVDQVAKLAKVRGDLMLKLDVQQAKIRHEFYAMLSEEQKQELEALSRPS